MTDGYDGISVGPGLCEEKRISQNFQQQAAVTNDFSVKFSLRLASSLLSLRKVLNNSAPLIKPLVPPRAAEIEIKASLHQKCRTFLKLSHQDCLISCRRSVWTSVEGEKTRLQRCLSSAFVLEQYHRRVGAAHKRAAIQKNAVMWGRREYQRLQKKADFGV